MGKNSSGCLAVQYGVLLADIKTKKLYLGNNKICQMLGYTQKEIQTLRVNDIHPRKELTYVLGQFEKQVKNEITLSENMPMLKKNGRVFYADVNSSSVKLDGKTYLMGIFREKLKPDKTVQQLIEEKVRDDAALKSIGDGLIVLVDVDKGGRIIYVNKPFEDMTGWKLKEILNKNIISLLPREDKEGKIVPFKETNAVFAGSLQSQ